MEQGQQPYVVGATKNFQHAVAAVSPTDVWAVGYSEGGTVGATDAPLIEHFDGQSWKIVPSVYPAPSPFNVLYGIAALSPTNIWAVGYANENSQGKNGQALIEHWDGTRWTLVSSPSAGNATLLYSVAAVSSTNIWAVGYIQPATSNSCPSLSIGMAQAGRSLRRPILERWLNCLVLPQLVERSGQSERIRRPRCNSGIWQTLLRS
jgi:hypothetical protein